MFCAECVYTKPGVWRSAEGNETLKGPSTGRKGYFLAVIRDTNFAPCSGMNGLVNSVEKLCTGIV